MKNKNSEDATTQIVIDNKESGVLFKFPVGVDFRVDESSAIQYGLEVVLPKDLEISIVLPDSAWVDIRKGKLVAHVFTYNNSEAVIIVPRDDV